MVPIRTRLTVLADGSTTDSPSVFCERRRCSVAPGCCVKCGGRVANDIDGGAAVECPWSEALPATTTADPWSVVEWRPVGLALARRVVCVMEDAPLTASTIALGDGPGCLGVPVVDRQQRLVGLLARAAATLALLGPSVVSVVGQYAKPVTATLAESDTLLDAFRLMGHHHSRELLVTGSDHTISGVLRDIDALRLVAAARRAQS